MSVARKPLAHDRICSIVEVQAWIVKSCVRRIPVTADQGLSGCGSRAERSGQGSAHSAACLARAVLAAVLGARSAGLDEALLQRLSSAEDAHAGVASRKAALLRERLHWCALHIDCLQRLRVFLFESPRQACNAGADFRP